MANKIQIRRDTTANWTASDPILSQGELGLDTTLNKVKIGNGTSHWSALSFYFDVPSTLENGSHTVELNSTGGINFPTLSVDIHNGGVQSAQVLKFDKALQQVIITGPTPAAGANAQRIIIQGQRATGRNIINNQDAEGGDVYLWGGDSDYNGGDIKIYAGDADSNDINGSIGGYVNISAGNGFTNGGHLTLSAGVANALEDGAGGNVSITAGYAHNGTPGNIQLSTYAQSNNAVLSWTFTNDGKLQLPAGGDIVNNAGIPITDVYKFAYGIIGTKANTSNPNDWGDYNITLDPGGESWAGIGIPSVSQQNSNGSLFIYNNKSISNSIQLSLAKGTFQFKGNGELELPTAPFTGVTNVDQLISTRIYRPTPNNDATAINNAKDDWVVAENSYVNVRDQDESITGYTRAWHNMPSWEAYPLIMSYETSQGELPPPSNLAPTTKTAMDAYLAWRQLQANIDIVTGNKTFSFENTGNLTLPNGTKLISGYPEQGYVADTVTLAGAQVYLASTNGNSWVGVENDFPSIGHGIYRWDFTSNGSTEFAGDWKFDNQFGTTIFPNNRLLAPVNTNLDIKVTNYGSNPVLSLTNTDKTWTFDKFGKVILPNTASISESNNLEISNASAVYVQALESWITSQASWQLEAANSNITAEGWPFIEWSVQGDQVTIHQNELTNAWQVQNIPSSPPTALIFNPPISMALYTEIRNALSIVQNSYTYVNTLLKSIDITAGTEKLTLLANGKLVVPDIIQNTPEENLILRTRYAVASSPPGTPLYTNRDWTFGTNGTLTFPDTTIQTTAYVSHITNTAANGSASLIPGYVMTRGNRLEVRTVYTDPNSLNMEFRYQGLGDQVAITANNGTNIFSGTSIDGTTWTRFNPAVFVNPGEKAEVVICDQSYHKIYRVTAIMRDAPTGNDGSGSVYCTIEELK